MAEQRAGKHVIMEKPLALTRHDVDMLYDLARFRDAILMRDEAIHYRMRHQSRAAAGVLEDAAAKMTM